MTKAYLLSQLRKKHACNDALGWVRTLPEEFTLEEALSQCPSVDWIMWVFTFHDIPSSKYLIPVFEKYKEWLRSVRLTTTSAFENAYNEGNYDLAVYYAMFYNSDRFLVCLRDNLDVSLLRKAIDTDPIVQTFV